MMFLPICIGQADGIGDSWQLLLPNSASFLWEDLGRRRSLELLVDAETEFHINVDLAELGVSIIDHIPEEILCLSVQNLVWHI
ncbi:calcium-dependent lipid-binding-like protein [Medicago truncatula]|uniref:Calcium-dependent lipid-binding-like protein n=1 Tax=Medicago truncatula TaxID=3880 RepID=G7I522_MEDTR|nr:calcium-dependent lipid-binding-like protein [Medicago truncatula]